MSSHPPKHVGHCLVSNSHKLVKASEEATEPIRRPHNRVEDCFQVRLPEMQILVLALFPCNLRNVTFFSQPWLT